METKYRSLPIYVFLYLLDLAILATSFPSEKAFSLSEWNKQLFCQEE